MKKTFAMLIAFSAVLWATHGHAQLLDPPSKTIYPESSEDSRLKQAKTLLTGTKDVVLVYAKGLCCPSCAIGIRKMVSRLDFVDSSGSNKGVDLDPKFQLVTFKIKDGKKADLAQVARAIDDAGYDPVRVYRMEKKKVLSDPLVVRD